MPQSKHKRRNKLIKPALQLKIVLIFFGTASVAVLVQAIMMSRALTNVPELSNAEHSALLTYLPGILMTNLAVSVGVLLPLISLIGITVTHRIVGPVYRFEQYLGQIARGETPGPCTIRDNDELHDLCDAINEATAVCQQPATGHEERLDAAA